MEGTDPNLWSALHTKIEPSTKSSARIGRGRKVPNGSTRGSCIYLDSEDSDNEDTEQSSAYYKQDIARETSLLSSKYDPFEALPAAGQASLLSALSQLNEQWSDEIAPLSKMVTSLGSSGESSFNLDRSSLAGQSSVQSNRTKESGTIHHLVPGVTTTLMIRNIPLRFTPVSLRELIDAEGFSGRYDYFYMPMDFRSHRSLGYCFINFYEAHSAAEFVDKFDNFKFASTRSDKVLSISAGARQGLLANVASFKLSTLKQMPRVEFRPVVAILGQLFPLDEEVYKWLLTGSSQRYNTREETRFLQAPFVGSSESSSLFPMSLTSGQSLPQ